MKQAKLVSGIQENNIKLSNSLEEKSKTVTKGLTIFCSFEGNVFSSSGFFITIDKYGKLISFYHAKFRLP
jgi:hypothetical protein